MSVDNQIGTPAAPPPVAAPVAAGSATNALGISAGTTADTAAQLYGYLAVYLNTPEVGDILRQAAIERWDPTKLEAALSQTDWWKNSQESTRTFDAKWQTDRGSVQAQIAQQAATLRTELTAQGIQIDDARLNEIAKEALRMNWSPEQTKAAMDSELSRSPSVLASKVGTDFTSLAQQYGVELSPDTVQQWAAHSISGVKSTEMYREFLVRNAKSRFQDAGLGKWLDGGGTTSQFYDPYKQRAAARLGIAPDSVDLSDPKWFAALNGLDPKTNQVRALTLNEWDQKLQQDPQYGYTQTPAAKNEAYGMISDFQKSFGTA